jgi:hypothetical protein
MLESSAANSAMIVPWQPAHRAAQMAGKIEVLGRKPAAMDEAETGLEDRRPDLGHALRMRAGAGREVPSGEARPRADQR